MISARSPEIIKAEQGGLATKLLVRFEDNLAAEVVYINRPDKNIICFSTMIGCPIGCVFCYSGVEGSYTRKLTMGEMYKLIDNAVATCITIADLGSKPLLFSAMGEGEPALNSENLYELFRELPTLAVRYGAPSCKFAVSTTAPTFNSLHELVVLLQRLPQEVKLQYSLHANPLTRMVMIPRGSKVPVDAVLSILANSTLKIELNVTLIKGVNDRDDQMRALSDTLDATRRKWKIKLNRFNPIANSDLEPSDHVVYMYFKGMFEMMGHEVEYYQTDGSEIDAACGQLHYRHIQEAKETEMSDIDMTDVAEAEPEVTPSKFQAELTELINRHSMEEGSDTPDFILAKYMEACLHAYNEAVSSRDNWHATGSGNFGFGTTLDGPVPSNS